MIVHKVRQHAYGCNVGLEAATVSDAVVASSFFNLV
jgi:hypothetical protein